MRVWKQEVLTFQYFSFYEQLKFHTDAVEMKMEKVFFNLPRGLNSRKPVFPFCNQQMVLFALMLYVPVNNFSVMSGLFSVFLGWTSTKQQTKSLAQEYNTVTLVSLELATIWSQD